MAYRILCGATGGLILVLGAMSFGAFFRYQAPGGEGTGPLPIGPGGAYYLGSLGCALVVWGGALIMAARRPAAAPWLASLSATALVMSALYRMAAWFLGDYAYLGNVLRVEAALFLGLALAFVWLKPRAHAAVTQA